MSPDVPLESNIYKFPIYLFATKGRKYFEGSVLFAEGLSQKYWDKNSGKGGEEDGVMPPFPKGLLRV